MSDADRVKWDARYAAREHDHDMQPNAFLAAHVGTATPGPALDVACGTGRNARFLASRGFQVDALDISPVGLAHARRIAAGEGLRINWQCQDLLHSAQIPRRDYQLIIMIHFVAFELMAELADCLAPGGVLIVEEHLQWPGPVSGPASDRFRVAPGSVPAAVPNLQHLVYAEGLVTVEHGADAALAQLVARKSEELFSSQTEASQK